MLNGHTYPSWKPREIAQQPQQIRQSVCAQYNHVLVPTSLADRERAALLTGLQLAAFHGARVSVLHILPPEEPDHSLHWLDAIGHLHRALLDTPGQRTTAKLIEQGHEDIQTFLRKHVPSSLQEQVCVHVECRRGDVTEEIARFASDRAVDLLVLATSRPGWRLPFQPSVTRRVLQLISQPAILIHPSR